MNSALLRSTSNNNIITVNFNNNQENTEFNTEINNVYKVNKPILDKEYLNKPSFNYVHKQQLPLSKEEIEIVKNYFYNKKCRYKANTLRNYTYFVLSINIARRCGDITKLKIEDVVNEDGTIKDHLVIAHEQKTKKKAIVPIDSIVKEALTEYLNAKKSYKMSDYLFTNYQTGNKMSVNGMYKMLKRMEKETGLEYLNIGTHSLRRTWAYHASKNNPNNSKTEIMISKALNHSDVETTHIYMQKTQPEIDNFFEANSL